MINKSGLGPPAFLLSRNIHSQNTKEVNNRSTVKPVAGRLANMDETKPGKLKPVLKKYSAKNI